MTILDKLLRDFKRDKDMAELKYSTKKMTVHICRAVKDKDRTFAVGFAAPEYEDGEELDQD